MSGAVFGGKQCPIIVAFDEIRTGGLSADPDDTAAVERLGGTDDTCMVWNESEYWLAARMIAVARGKLEDPEKTFARLYGDGATDDLIGVIERESPVGRQMTLLRPVLEALAAAIMSRVNGAAMRGESVNLSIGHIPEDIRGPVPTEHIIPAVNEFVDFANSLNVVAVGGVKPPNITRLPAVDIQPMPTRTPSASSDWVIRLDTGITQDRQIAAVGKLYEAIHADGSRKLNEVFSFCRAVLGGMAS